jgi:exodeoxyribonuclease VII large subunit
MADTQESRIKGPPVSSDSTRSVEELNTHIDSVLRGAQDRFPSYVVGEISDVAEYGFGTVLDLRDLPADARISCII